MGHPQFRYGKGKSNGWRVPRLLILGALPTQWVPRSFAFFAKGRELEMLAPRGFDHASTTKSNSTRNIVPTPSASSGQALAKNARMGHPQFRYEKGKSNGCAMRWARPFALSAMAGAILG
jgi:hypothetical protein